MKKAIYFMQETDSGAIKIGFSRNVGIRKNNMQTNNSSELKTLGLIEGSIADEMKIHQKFGHLRIRGEWYKPEAELLDFITLVTKEGNIPIDLGKAIVEFEGKPTTEPGKECKKWIEIANNLPVEEETNEILSIDAAAKLLGISAHSLRKWEEQGKIKPHYTAKGHRRYTRKQILDIRKQQMDQKELLLPGITPAYLLQAVQMFLQSFDPLEKVNVSLAHDTVLGKVRISVEAADGLTTVSKSFNIKH